MDQLVRMEAVSFAYGDDGGFDLMVPSLAFAANQHAAIVGPSGCGKTTLLSLIAGVLKPAAGLIDNQGVLMSELDDRDRRRFRIQQIGLVFQSFELLDYLDVRDNVLLPYRVHPDLELTPSVFDRADVLIESVGLEGKQRRGVSGLSQGERQRVAVARSLITEPPLLLADEPTGNLDPSNKLKIIDLLLENAHQSRSTIIAVTHDHSLLDRFDRVVEFETIGC